MKIKSNLYCITDKNNKPDYRFLFEDAKDAKKKINQIKNSTKGETLFISQNKRDFFVDGVKKEKINPHRKISIKRGCWTGLKVKQVQLLDTMDPKNLFKKVVKAETHEFSYTKEKVEPASFKALNMEIPSIPNPMAIIDWENSFLRTKTFAAALGMLVITTVASVFMVNNQATDKISRLMMDSQSQNAQKLAVLQTRILMSKEESVANQFDEDLNKLVMDTLKNFSNLRGAEFENEVHRLLAGSPMEKMVPYIMEQDKTVAAFLVGIAKKESNLGRRVPVLNGEDCYNYWGYRGIRSRMGTGGHTCFDSPQDAVSTVAGRIQELVNSEIDTPQEMSLWKCGSACANDPQVGKWISDVNLYYSKLKEKADQIEAAQTNS